MSKHIAHLSIGAALLACAALPGAAAAADLYGYGGGGRPPAFSGPDDGAFEGARPPAWRGDDPRFSGGYRRAPGPVVFDERGAGPFGAFAGEGWGGRGPAERPAYGYGGPVAFAPRVERFSGAAPAYRPVAVPAGPVYGEGGPDSGCTTEQVRSTTPAGWRKIVTRSTCYRR